MKTVLNQHLMLPRLNRSLLSTLSLAVLCAMAFTFTCALAPMMNTANAQSGALTTASSRPCYNQAMSGIRTARENHASAQVTLMTALDLYDEMVSAAQEDPFFNFFVYLASLAVETARSNLQAAAIALVKSYWVLARCVE